MRVARRTIEEKLRANLLPVFTTTSPDALIELKDALAAVHRYALEELEERHRHVRRASAERWLDEVRDLERSDGYVLHRGELSPLRSLVTPWIARFYGCAVGSMNDYCPETERRLSRGRMLVFGRFHRALALELVASVACAVIEEAASEFRWRVRHHGRGQSRPLGDEQVLETRFLQRLSKRLERARECGNVQKRIDSLVKQEAFRPDFVDGFGIEGDLLLASRAAYRRALDVDAELYLYGWKRFIGGSPQDDLESVAFL